MKEILEKIVEYCNANGKDISLDLFKNCNDIYDVNDILIYSDSGEIFNNYSDFQDFCYREDEENCYDEENEDSDYDYCDCELSHTDEEEIIYRYENTKRLDFKNKNNESFFILKEDL